MFAEYGVDPHLIANWANDPIGDVLRPLFGVSTGRLVSRFPKDWARTVRNICDQETDPNKKKKIEVLLIHLSQKLVSRNRERYLDARSWLENSEDDNDRIPFKKILSTSNPRLHQNVLVADQLTATLIAEFENREGTFSIEKTSFSMVNFFGNLLRCANEIKFIDKNFHPNSNRFTEPLAALLKVATQRRPGGRINKIEYHVKHDDPNHTYDKSVYLRTMPSIIPTGLSVDFIFWEEVITWGLHNRYLITDIGGFSFGMGLDNSPPRNIVSDTVSRLDATSLGNFFNKFSTTSQHPEIKRKDKLTIVGQA